jgi:hypothetical protein
VEWLSGEYVADEASTTGAGTMELKIRTIESWTSERITLFFIGTSYYPLRLLGSSPIITEIAPGN